MADDRAEAQTHVRGGDPGQFRTHQLSRKEAS